MTRRTGKRGAEKVQARYDAAGNGRRMKAWTPASSGPNRAIEGLQRLRDRARDSTRNDWAGASGVQKWTTNLVGVGITPRWENEETGKRWAKFVALADADGVLDLYGMQTLAVRSWLDSGEVFLRRRPRPLVFNLPAPVQFQLIEADYCPLFDATAWPGMPDGNSIRQGIERNKYGRRTAYWMYTEHPGDKGLAAPTATQLIRIPASEISHMFEPKRPGQLRGVSELAPVLARLRSSMDFEDAVLDRQKLANLFTMFITRTLPEAADIDYDPDTGLPKWYDKDGTPMVGLEPGISQKLQPGEEVKFSNPPEAGTTFSEYLRTTHLGTAAGVNLPYEIMSGDIKDVSDRTLRVVINEFRRFARQRQWQIVIPMICQPMVNWWTDAEALAGTIALSMVEAQKAAVWSPEGWEYIHPTQDAEGKKTLIEIGVASRDEIIAERGNDPRTVDKQRAEGLKREKKLDLLPPPPPAPAAAPKGPPKPTALEEAQIRAFNAQAAETTARMERAAVPAEVSAQDHFLAGLSTQMVALSSAVTAIASRPAAVVNVEPSPVAVQNNIPAPIVNMGDVHVDNNVQVEPTPVTVAVDVQPTPVSVAAPVVEITNNVPPAEVTVNLPTRKTESDVTRDPVTGNILRVTQTEKTIQ